MSAKKVGFIDYYLDEWHANNYPQFFRERSGGKYEVAIAYGQIDNPKEGGITNKEWSGKYGVPLAQSIEEVIEKSDVLVVLAPNYPEKHEELCDLPLKSGKLVYIDKTFAPDRKTAQRIFDHAKKYGTKCFSSSALRFAEEYKGIDRSKISRIYSEGAGTYEMYSIHQIEPIVCLMQNRDTPVRATRVMYTGSPTQPSMVIEFDDGRCAHMYQGAGLKFRITTVDSENKAKPYEVNCDFFGLFIDALIEFYETGAVPVVSEQTVDVIGIRTAGLKAMETPFVWVAI